nr:MAG TPA_asm: hypothetical protein [Bacteriophage sp.]DAT97302.1 MAG TPA: hypothetical protein [Caudoviricetes sp.]DAZ24528.1 MAG TPA: hypothetical protein [Caudoviricetes sp.]
MHLTNKLRSLKFKPSAGRWKPNGTDWQAL